MTRIFLPPEQLISEQIIITGDHARHLSLVLRVKPGEPLIIFDGSGHKFFCNILQVHKKEVVVEKVRQEPCSAESPVSIILAQGIAKGEKMDLIIQKATELGVNRIIPLITERSEVRHTEKVGRWRKIALSAAEQSGRERIPEIEEPIEFGEFIEQDAVPLQMKLIFSEEHNERNFKKILLDHKNANNILILVGPEGGFAKDEVTAAVEKGFIEASLGQRILRTETAPISALSIIQYELGDMG